MSDAVSFSRMQGYKKCPASYEWKYLLGNPGNPPGPAAARGTRIHNSIEDFHNGVGDLDEEIPLVMADYVNTYYDVDGWKAYPELEFGFTSDWEITTFEADDCYIRGKMDGVFVEGPWVDPTRVVIDEYKTGKEYPEHADQKAMYALASLVIWPTIESVVVSGVYLDLKKIKPTTYMRAHLPAMQFEWKRQIDKLKIPIYPARPGFHCRWCTKSHKGGGPCQVG